MEAFNSLQDKINNWLKGPEQKLSVYGVHPHEWIFTSLSGENKQLRGPKLFVFPQLEEAEEFYNALKKMVPRKNLLLFPGLEQDLYSSVLESERNLYERLKALDLLTTDPEQQVIVSTFDGLFLKVPNKDFFSEHSFNLQVEDIISPEDLKLKLVEIGYDYSITVEEPGTFSSKGEIFDIFPMSSGPIRLHYFDELIESIHPIDLKSQRTLKEIELKSIRLGPCPHILTRESFRNQLRANIPQPAPGNLTRFEKRKEIFNRLSSGELFEDYVNYFPLFFSSSSTLLDYLPENCQITLFESFKIQQEMENFKEDLRATYEGVQEDTSSDNLLGEPEYFFDTNFEFPHNKKVISCNYLHITDDEDSLGNTIELNLEPSRSFIFRDINPTLNKFEQLKEVFSNLSKILAREGFLIIACHGESSKEEIKYLLEENGLTSTLGNRLSFIEFPLQSGFYYKTGKTLVLSDSDLFGNKKSKAKSTSPKHVDLFAEQLSTLQLGDYVIHNEHGMGKYTGMQTMAVGGSSSDFLIIEYTQGDKVYVPVYKLNLIQKHSDATLNIKVDSLRTNKFSKLKEKARNAIKTLAFDLLKLQAERESSDAFTFSPPDHLYYEFELAFPFTETPDQKEAIHDVLDSMQKPKPMDHLVCGDVGFGKTEVAIRAAFKAVLDKKQVAVLVPTTVLAYQHFHSFQKRLKDFPVNVDYLSRFKSPKQRKETLQKVEGGKVDIIIGTHMLLSDKIKFKDLGLVVVDEEQRFGVNHKEKLKLMKSTVDFLTLTATPIPRTLQLAFLGLKELSLIKTAPPKRQSIKTYVIKEDFFTIKEAIERELSRGGQVFIVHNRVKDIEKYTYNIQQLVPSAKIVYAHGQMSETELEKRITGFYEGQYQILVSTTIIESGIDIPNANTMIINRADTFGLSQLHQLRGRIGRSEKKAYAYFVIPKTGVLTDIARKRIKAIQTYADKGSGFNIANCDLEIRGAGDILGAYQSGHIESIGLELYMELLKEAIDELKGEKQIINRDIEIITPFPCFIPNNFIEDAALRLKEYKRLSNCTDFKDLEAISEELEDIFGPFPSELRHLFTIFEVRIKLQKTGIKSVKVAGSIISLEFDKNILDQNPELKGRVIDTFISRPKKFQFSPNYKVVYTHKKSVDTEDLLKFAEEIAELINLTN